MPRRERPPQRCPAATWPGPAIDRAAAAESARQKSTAADSDRRNDVRQPPAVAASQNKQPKTEPAGSASAASRSPAEVAAEVPDACAVPAEMPAGPSPRERPPPLG